MISEVQIYEMAKLVYITSEGAQGRPWKELPSEGQEQRVQKVRDIIDNFYRLGFGILPLDYVKPDTRKPIDRVILENFIKDFIVARVKKPSGIVNIFPYQELALEICKEFKIDEAI